MNKIAKGLITTVLVCVGVSGCKDHERAQLTVVKDKLTPIEYTLLRDFTRQHALDYYSVLMAVLKKREVSPPLSTYPFCEDSHLITPVTDTVVDHSHKEDHSLINKVRVYFPDWDSKCLSAVTPVDEMPKPKDAAEVDPVSLGTLDDLIESAKQCNTAKVLIISKESSAGISETEANRIIEDCRWDKLREELNK